MGKHEGGKGGKHAEGSGGGRHEGKGTAKDSGYVGTRRGGSADDQTKD